MFGMLLESRAHRQRRPGGAALSVATHLAIIGAATAATAHGTRAPRRAPEMVVVRFTPPPRPAEHPHAAATAHVSNSLLPSISVPRIAVPTIVPTSLPTIEAAQGPPIDSVVIGLGGGAARSGPPGLVDAGDDAPSGGEWRGTELMMRIVSSAKPRYPESLRQAGVDGRVVVRFVVDTLGRVEMTSIQVVQSTHDLFTRAVRDVLPSYRFKPSEVQGKRVMSLAEMPFEFAIKR